MGSIDSNILVHALIACSLLASSTVAASQPKPAADLIITNASVWTVDPNQPRAEAIAMLGERIVAVGSVGAVDQWRGGTTRVIDARGHLLLPGFNDAHVHFSNGGLSLDSLDLRDALSPSEFARRIAERAKTTKRGEWITGGNWNDQVWAQKSGGHAELPTRQLIDDGTRNVPVLVSRLDGHMALANTAALKIIGITRDTPNPHGGEIVRDRNGEPTGILKDAAMGQAFAKVPTISREQRLKAVRRAMEHAAHIGVTSVQDMNVPYEDLSVYAELAEHH